MIAPRQPVPANQLAVHPAKLLAMRRSHRSSRAIVARNLEFLRKLHPDNPSRRQVALKAGVAPQTINNLYRPDGPTPTLDKLDKLAGAHGLETWMLLLPSLPALIGHRKHLERLIERYANSDEAGQRLIDEVAERAVIYRVGREPEKE